MLLNKKSPRGNVESIYKILQSRCGISPKDPFIFSPDRQPLTWAGLADQLDYIGGVVGGMGLSPSDRVAVVLPDGPELATAFLTVSACATFAPLNPAYRAEDFEFYLTDLQAKALILPVGGDSPAREVAKKLGVEILEMTVDLEQPAGRFTLSSESDLCSNSSDELVWAGPEDLALVLHTSGTTSRPKLVPLTHLNLCSSANHIAKTLELTPDDLGLCVMPLFHIHGLMGAFLSSVVAGAPVVCTPGFHAQHFFEWLDEFQPTWFTAVPTMHQAILGLAPENMDLMKRHRIRFIRSSSAALPPTVMQGIETLFRSPTIESYGMTEASHQMASNPLPPMVRKAGSVGLAAGPEVSILSVDGCVLTTGLTGEIAIRGQNVTDGYSNNAEANVGAFCNGWFRTGDQGYIDEDGYLFITGRLKEVINRGGEKISPREIDEVLLKTPEVVQAVAFAAPHPSLGEDIVAAVVLKKGASISEASLREFTLDHLPAFKVPSRIIIINEIPKGPTGKIQRIGLAKRLAEELEVAFEMPQSDMERLIATTIAEVLGCAKVGRNDNFFLLGGDSLRATQMLVRLQSALGFKIPIPTIFRCPTPALLANKLEQISHSNIDALADELENLTDEEVASLLKDL
jgi:acyl-CoA synthetase (AMP-forming)/AMP-acid ligase II/acyl carrier protein